MNLSDRIVSLLRTAVPTLWGMAIAYVLGRWPAVRDFFDAFGVDLTSPQVAGAVTGAVVVLWYALWRWLEPRLPDWLTRLVLGSAAAPSYSAEHAGPPAEAGASPSPVRCGVCSSPRSSPCSRSSGCREAPRPPALPHRAADRRRPHRGRPDRRRVAL